MELNREFVGVGEAAQIVGVSRNRLLYLATRDRLPAIRTHKGRLFLRGDVIRFRKRRRERIRRGLAKNNHKP
jgi:hypothetical protein